MEADASDLPPQIAIANDKQNDRYRQRFVVRSCRSYQLLRDRTV